MSARLLPYPAAHAMPSELPSKNRINKAGERLAAWWGLELELPDEELEEHVVAALQWREQHAYPMALVMPSLRIWSNRYSTSDIRPAQRLKRLPQILGKLNRHPGMKLARMQDIGGARAVCTDREEVEQIYSRIKKNWEIVRVKDWREERSDTGYRALHVMVGKKDRLSEDKRVIEVQLRTASEHRWAEVVMTTGDRLGYALRDGDGPPDLLNYFRLAAEVLAIWDRGDQPEPGLRKRFADSREQVRPYFTTKGS